MADERQVNLVVNREYKFETHEAEVALKSLKNALAELNFYKFAKGEAELNKEARELLGTFLELGRDVSKLDTSKVQELVKYMNALTAKTGKSFTELFPDVSDIEGVVSQLRNAARDINSTYSEAAFKESYEAFDLLAKHGLDAFETLSKLAGNSEAYKSLEAEIARVTSELERQREAARYAKEELDQFKADNNVDRFRDLTSQATREFKAFLLANNIDESVSDGWSSVADLMENVRDGAMTAGEAITALKRDFSDYLPKETTGDLTGFATTLETILEKVEALRPRGSNSGGVNIVDNAEVDADTESIRRESDAIDDITSQSKGLIDVTTLISALVEAGKNAAGETSNIYESIIPIVQAVKDLSDVDTSKLRSLADIFEGFAGLNGFKVSPQQAQNLDSLLSVVRNAGDLGNLTKLSGVKLDGISNLRVSKASVDNLDRLVPLLSSLSNINSEELGKIAGIDYSRLDQIKVPDIASENLSSIEKLGSAMAATRDVINALSQDFGKTGAAAATSAAEIAKAASKIKAADLPLSGSKRVVALNNTFGRANQGQTLLDRASELGMNQKGNENLGSYNNIAYVVRGYRDLHEAAAKATITQREYNEEYQRLNAIANRASKELSAAIKTETETRKEAAKQEAEASRESVSLRRAMGVEYDKHNQKIWNEATVEELNHANLKMDEYIKKVKAADEAEERAAERAAMRDAKRQIEVFDYDEDEKLKAEEADAAETERINKEIAATYELAAKQQEELIRVDNKRHEQYIANRKKEEEVEERAAQLAAKRAIQSYDYDENQKLKAESADAKAAERENADLVKAEEVLRRVIDLRGKYTEQIEKSNGAWLSPEGQSELDRLKEERDLLLRMEDALSVETAAIDNATVSSQRYDTALKNLGNSLKTATSILNRDIASAPLTGGAKSSALTQISTARNKIGTTVARAERADVGNIAGMEALRSADREYEKLAQSIEKATISEAEFRSEMTRIGQDTANANSAIGSQITDAEKMRKVYDALRETMTGARDEWDMLPDEERAQLDSWISGLDELNQQFKDGTITRDAYEQGMESLNDQFKVLNDRVKEGSVNAHSFKEGTTESYNSLVQINSAISRGSKALNDYTAAEKSKNQTSREGYKEIQNAVNGLRDLEKRRREGTISTEEAAREQQKYNAQIEHGTSAIMANGDAHVTAFGKIGRAVKTHLTTLTATSIIGSVMREARQMVTTITEIDTAMTELRKVTDETEERYSRFLDNSATRAKNLSATISDTVTATADFARLGLSIDQAEIAADAAIVYKAVGDDINTIDDAAQSIISTMKAFGIQAADSMQIVDKFNEVGNRFAISSGGIGEALKRSASAMYAANNTLDETIGLATAANTILQNPQSVGTTLKTVSMYVRAAKTELEAAGEETDGIAESTGKLRDLIMQITREGGTAIDIMADDNTFKSTYQILEEISKVWDKLSDANQAALLEKLGGKRNANAIAAILENFEIAQQAMEVAQGASEGMGSAMKELDKYQQSIEGHIVGFKTAYQELAQTLIDGDLVKKVIDLGKGILEMLTSVGKLVDKLGGLKSILTAIAGLSISSKIGSIAQKLGQLTFSGVGRGVIDFAKSMVGYFTGPAGIVRAATLAVTAIISFYSVWKSKQRETRSGIIEMGETARDNADSLIELYDKYGDLSQRVETDSSVKSDLIDVTNQLISRLGIEKKAVSDLGDEYGKLNGQIQERTLDELYKDKTLIEADLAAKDEEVMEAFDRSLGNKFLNRLASWEVWANESLSGKDVEVLKKAGYEKYIKRPSSGNGTLIDFGQVHSAYQANEMYQTAMGMLNTLTENGLGASDIFTQLSKRIGAFSGELDAYNETEKKLEEISSKIASIEKNETKQNKQADTVNDLKKRKQELSERVDILRDYIEAYEDFIEKEREAEDAGYSNISETVFGNIDTDNRQILKWTQEAIERYRDVLESWGYTEEEMRDLAGSISTVLGTTMSFDDLEIAFSPILQTDDGPVLLSSDTVAKYINALLNELRMRKGEWTDVDLFDLDTRGIEIDGIKIKNIIASVGEDAERVSRVMHFAGSDGALADAFVRLRSAANKAGIPLAKFRDRIDDVREEAEKGKEAVEELNKQISELEGGSVAPKSFRKDITEYANRLKVLTDAWKEYQENGKITSLTYQKLNDEFKDESGLVEIVNGKLSLNADAVEKLNTKLRDEYGLKIALAGASEEEISYLDSLSAALENLAEKTEDPTSELKELTSVLSDMREGVELSTFDTLELIQKYPQLRDKIIATANGYQIEESAIRDLIQVKSQLLKLNEREIGITSARTALVTRAGGEQTAAKVDKIFADFEAANGKAITSIKEFAKAYYEETGSVYRTGAEAQGAVFEEYSKYVNALIDLNNGLEVDASALAMIVDDLNGTVKEGYDPSKDKTTGSSSSEKEETAFEKAYKLHQHYLAMDQETVEQYLNWLDGAYKASYAAGEMELDDYYKYEEEVYEKRKELFQTNLDQMQHQVDLLSHKTEDTSSEQIAIYEKMQKELNAQANRYRARGIKENDELIRELQNQWWQYEENIRQLRESAFNDWLSDSKFTADQLKLDNASTDEILSAWKEILSRINSELEYYANKGYDTTTDVVQSLIGELQSAKESMIAILDDVVQKANDVVDGFENVYKTLTDAAKEYASTGYLSVDSLQSILSLGPKYLDMLTDESGQLVINEDRLQKVIAARTEEMAAETALSYAKQVLLATEQEDADALRELTDVQAASSAATWDMAYATLGYAKALAESKGMSIEFYDNAISYVTKMQSVTKTAVDSVSAYYATLNDGYVSQADGLETILKLTEDMIKQENSDRIDMLEKEKDLYKDIIDEKKEILRLTKEQEDHDRDMADKLKEIADLQSRIDQLALDDSREAQAQRTKLEAELYEKQKALADNQADYAYEAQTEALDKQYEEYEKEKDDEIDALKKMLGSAEQQYRAAIERINNGWDTLYEDLLDWNYKYGSTLEKDLVAAWDAAKAAAERYGSFVDAMEGVNSHTDLGTASTTPASASVQSAVAAGSAKFSGGKDIIDRMRANSIAWFTGDRAYLSGENQKLALDYKAATGKTLDYRNGSWYEEGSSTPIYNLANDQAARNQIGAAVVAAMKSNSELWKSADASQRTQIELRNEDLAAKLANFLGKSITKTKSGVWMLGDTPLYSVTKFHSGGVAGGGTLKQNEIMALLKKGEAVLDEKRERGLYNVVDFVQILSDKIGRVIDSGRLGSLLNGTAPIFRNLGSPALAGGIGTMNFSPTVNVTIAGAGDLSESTARKYGNIAADSVLEQLKSAFTQRGVSNVGNGILK